MANIKLGGTTAISESSGAITIPAGTLGSGVTFPAGHILQVKSTCVKDRNSTGTTSTTGTGADVGLNVTITPVSSTSDFFIQLHVGIVSSASSNSNGFILSKGTSSISDATKMAGANGADNAGNATGVWVRGTKYTQDTNHALGISAHYLDTVSGSGVRTYKAGLVSQTSTVTYINRSANNDPSALVYGSLTSSSLTVMEIQGA